MGQQLNEHSQLYWVARFAAGKVLGVLSTAFMAVAVLSFWVGNMERRYDKQIQELKDANAALKEDVAKIKAALAPLKTTPAKASWYGQEFHGRKTASGVVFDKNKVSVAHRTLPLGALVYLRHKTRAILVPVTDRGPAASTGRDIDVSEKAAELLGFKEAGVAFIQVGRVR